MDMEEMRQLLAQEKLRCLILEADKDAENLRSQRYRSILGEMMGEGDTRVEAAQRPQTSGLHLMPWNASAHSTSPAVRHIRIFSA